MMTETQALLSGLIRGALSRIKADGYPGLQVEERLDGQGDYLPVIVASMNGERYAITVTPDHSADQAQEAQEAPRPPETGHYITVAEDGEVSFLHPIRESETVPCEVLEAYRAGLLPIAQQPPGRYVLYWQSPDQGDLDDAPAPVWYLVRLIDGAVDPALSALCLIEIGWNGQTGRFVRCVLPKGHDGGHDRNDGGDRSRLRQAMETAPKTEPVRTFAIPLPVTLVSVSRSGYILQDRWDWFWMVPPEGAGEPYHMNEATAEKTTGTSDWDLVGQSFTTWEGLHYFLRCRVTHRTEESGR